MDKKKLQDSRTNVQKVFDSLGKTPFPTDHIVGYAMRGEMHRLVDFFHRNDTFAHGLEVRHEIIRKMIEEPAKFTVPLKIFEFVTSKNFDYEKFFQYSKRRSPDMDVISACWSMRERAPSVEMTKVSVVLLAEGLRRHILEKGHSDLDAASLLGANKDSFKLTYAMARANKIAQFIITQNALVLYIDENADKLPMHRGAPFLKVVRDDMDSTLWSRKMIDFRENRLDGLHIQDGATRFSPVYAPS